MNDAFIADPSMDNPLILGENREQDADENHLNLGFLEDSDDSDTSIEADPVEHLPIIIRLRPAVQNNTHKINALLNAIENLL